MTISGDPAALERAAGQIDAAASQFDRVADQLRSAATLAGGGWQGLAAEGFAAKAAQVARRADDVAGTVRGASPALLAYATELRAAQQQFSVASAAHSAAVLRRRTALVSDDTVAATAAATDVSSASSAMSSARQRAIAANNAAAGVMDGLTGTLTSGRVAPPGTIGCAPTGAWIYAAGFSTYATRAQAGQILFDTGETLARRHYLAPRVQAAWRRSEAARASWEWARDHRAMSFRQWRGSRYFTGGATTGWRGLARTPYDWARYKALSGWATLVEPGHHARYQRLAATHQGLQARYAAPGLIARTGSRVANRLPSGVRTAGRVGGRALGVAGVGVSLVQTGRSAMAGDVEGTAVNGAYTVGGAMMMSGVAPVMIGGAVLVGGTMIYEYRHEIGGALQSGWNSTRGVREAVGDGVGAAVSWVNPFD